MTTIECPACDTSLSVNSVFCHTCGSRIKCGFCENILVNNAKFCSSCGHRVELDKHMSSPEKNTIKYHRTKDEIFCEVSLTDEVGKEGIQSLIENITNQKNVNYSKIPEAELSLIENTSLDEKDYDTEIANVEDVKINKQIDNEKLSDTPHLSDVEINVNCSETDWILIYAFYESNFAKKTFTKKAVYDRYMSKRKTDSRSKNFSTYWKRLFKDYFATVNDIEIKIKLNDLSHLYNLINGDSKDTSRATITIAQKNKIDNSVAEKSTTKPKAANKTTSYQLVTNLNLYPKDNTSLKEFYDGYKAKKTAEIILLIVYYLERVINEHNIDENKIYTCYKNLTLSVPNIRTALVNMHNRQGYLNTSSYVDLKITLAGENYLEHKMNKIT